MIFIEKATQGFRASFHMLVKSCSCFAGTLLVISLLARPTFAHQRNHYTRFEDPTWYARQLQSLQEQVAKIDADISALAEARKCGKGVTDAVALEQEAEGVTSGTLAGLRGGRGSDYASATE